ncbi:hypothetical protein [Hydrogenimonas sp.]
MPDEKEGTMERVEYEFFDNGTVKVKRESGASQGSGRGKRGLYPDFSEGGPPVQKGLKKIARRRRKKEPSALS